MTILFFTALTIAVTPLALVLVLTRNKVLGFTGAERRRGILNPPLKSENYKGASVGAPFSKLIRVSNALH